MIEKRATIKSIKEAKEKVEAFGSKYIANYVFTDIIFIIKKGDYNLNNDFIRMRVYTKNDWPTKRIVLVRKKTNFNKRF